MSRNGFKFAMHAGVNDRGHNIFKRYTCIPQVTTSSNSNTCVGDTTEGTNKLEGNYHTEGTSHKTHKTMKDTLFPHFFLKNKFDKFHIFKFNF